MPIKSGRRMAAARLLIAGKPEFVKLSVALRPPERARRLHPFAPSIAAQIFARSSFDQNIVAVHPHRETGNLDARIVDALSVGHVVFPTVPRTHHGGAHQIPLAQWAATMPAGVVDRIEPAAGVEERDLAPVNL